MAGNGLTLEHVTIARLRHEVHAIERRRIHMPAGVEDALANLDCLGKTAAGDFQT